MTLCEINKIIKKEFKYKLQCYSDEHQIKIMNYLFKNHQNPKFKEEKIDNYEIWNENAEWEFIEKYKTYLCFKDEILMIEIMLRFF